MFDEGVVRTTTLYACKEGVADNMCDTVAEVDARVLATTADEVLDNTTALIHVKDVPGRVFDANSGSVTDGTTVSWQTATDEDPDFTGTRNGVKVGWYRAAINDYLTNWQHYNVTYTASGLNGGAPPGLVSVRSRTSGAAFWALTSQNSYSLKRSTNYSLSSASTTFTVRLIEFEKLGTYVLDVTADFLHATIDEDSDGNPDTFSATGRTIYHVGPIAELGVSDGGASFHAAADRNALTIVAVNNRPEPSFGAQINGLPMGADVLRISHGSYDGDSGVWSIGKLEYKDQLRSAGKPEGATLVLGASAGETATARIAYEPYLVCIGSDGNDLAHTTETACEAVTGASWHEGTVYDYKPDNNTATITAARGTGNVGPGIPANPRTQTGTTTVMWDEVESLYGLAGGVLPGPVGWAATGPPWTTA